MESMQQRCLHKLYGCRATLLAREAALLGVPNITTYGSDELHRVQSVLGLIREACILLENDPDVNGEFQVELPF